MDWLYLEGYIVQSAWYGRIKNRTNEFYKGIIILYVVIRRKIDSIKLNKYKGRKWNGKYDL